MSNRDRIAWHFSTALHSVAFVFLCCVAPWVLQEPAANARRGVISLTMMLTDDALHHHAAQVHVHAPGVPQDHEHEGLPLTVHSHAKRLSPPATAATMVPLEVEAVASVPAPLVKNRPTENSSSEHPPALNSQQPAPLSRAARGEASAIAPTLTTQAAVVQATTPGITVDELPQQSPTNPPPPYPPEAFAQRQQGRVLLEVSLDAAGRTTNVRVLESSGYPSLDTSAEQTVRRWSFRPAMRNGMAVPYMIRVPIRFVIR